MNKKRKNMNKRVESVTLLEQRKMYITFSTCNSKNNVKKCLT